MTGDGRVSRREVLRVAGAGAALGAAVSTVTDEAAAAKTVVKRKGRIRQSIVHWCFKSAWSTEEMCVIAKKLGCPSIELCPTSDWPTLKKHGLTCAIAGIDIGAGPPFVRGFNNPKFHDQVIEATRKSIDASAEFGTPCVISFTGDMSGRLRAMPALAKGSDLMIAHNAIPEDATGIPALLHMKPSYIGKMAAEAGVKKLLLTHLMKRSISRQDETLKLIQESYKGPVEFPKDLDVFQP